MEFFFLCILNFSHGKAISCSLKSQGILVMSPSLWYAERERNVTNNGAYTASDLGDISMEATLCIRVLYWALACHWAQTARRCDNLVRFDLMARKISSWTWRIDVQNTSEALWRWFRRRPIFVGIDVPDVQGWVRANAWQQRGLMTAAGDFLDHPVNKERACVVPSAVST